MKKKWTTGKIIGVSMLLVLGVVILWIAFVASVYQLAAVIEGIERTTAGRAGITGDSDDMDGYDIEDFLNGDSDEEYYDFEQDIRDDLSYEVELEEFDKEDYDCPEGTEARLAITYPVVTGDIPNVEEINRKLYEEVTAADEYITAVADLMDSKEECKKCFARFYCSGGCSANSYNFNGTIDGTYEIGCKLERKRVECALMVKAALALEGETENEEA